MWPPRTVIIACVTLALAGCASPGSIGGSLPGPPVLMMIPPSPELAPELAAFYGTWEGKWGEVVSSRLIVERIDTESARVVYSWGDDPGGYFKAGWARFRAQVFREGKLQFGSGNIKFTFYMVKDRMSLEGERVIDRTSSFVIMKKVGP